MHSLHAVYTFLFDASIAPQLCMHVDKNHFYTLINGDARLRQLHVPRLSVALCHLRTRRIAVSALMGFATSCESESWSKINEC